MKKIIIFMIIVLSICVLATEISRGQTHKTTKNNDQQTRSIKVANFDKEDNLIRPEGYREWVFAGNSLGLSYRTTQTTEPSQKFYHVTYIHPDAYKEFTRTGKFPKGTMLVLEIITKEKKNEPGLHGSYSKDYVAMEVSVKDSKRFKDGWAYFGFNDDQGKLLDKAKAFASESCFSCHDKKAETDHVFTQFYSALSAAKPK